MAIHLSFSDLWQAYPQPLHGDKAVQRQSRLALFRQIGWEARLDLPDYENTCAVRMSLALIACGVNVAGNDPILAGQYKGLKIETGRVRLAARLRSPGYLGSPREIDLLKPDTYVRWGEQGIVSFDHMAGYEGGHIDLVRNAWLASAFDSHDLNRITDANLRRLAWAERKLDNADMGYADMTAADNSYWFRSTLYFWPLP